MAKNNKQPVLVKFGAALAGITPVLMLAVIFLCGIFISYKLIERLWTYLAGG